MLRELGLNHPGTLKVTQSHMVYIIDFERGFGIKKPNNISHFAWTPFVSNPEEG